MKRRTGTFFSRFRRIVGKGLKALFSLLFGGSEEAERLRHEREMANLAALERGRITPSYALRYAAVALFSLLCLLIVLDAAFPGLIPGTPAEAAERFAKLWGGALVSLFGL